MNQEELRNEAAEKKYTMLKTMPNSAKITVANQRAAFKEGAEWEAEREKWISVEDSLPDESNGRVLVWVNEQTDLGLSQYFWSCSYSSLHGFTDRG